MKFQVEVKDLDLKKQIAQEVRRRVVDYLINIPTVFDALKEIYKDDTDIFDADLADELKEHHTTIKSKKKNKKAKGE